MVEVLHKMYERVPFDRLVDMLPAGGVQGTLKNAFSASQPYVYAKTGSMRNVYNLSGFLITDSGRILIFSFMNNHVDRPFNELKQDMAKILETLKRDYR
jgi:D-alanyl-D-alanine carboxypeptidase/D-alanyl-D-alanine-endopeptidase (penicillin-binding protein 4)